MDRTLEVALQVLGTLGVALLLAAYAALQAGRLGVGSLRYHAANAAGSALILGSLFGAFNLPSAVIESVWLALSLWGGGRLLVARRKAAAQAAAVAAAADGGEGGDGGEGNGGCGDGSDGGVSGDSAVGERSVGDDRANDRERRGGGQAGARAGPVASGAVSSLAGERAAGPPPTAIDAADRAPVAARLVGLAAPAVGTSTTASVQVVLEDGAAAI
ncbi:hypothetical protein MMPV_000204 [Pyropia vietnamensis]